MRKEPLACASLSIRPGFELYHAGPPLDTGPLPTLFYFALSGPDSLCTDPYNQPVCFLMQRQIRVVSLTLPAHENTLSPLRALETWLDDFRKGRDPLDQFLDETQEALRFLRDQKLADPGRLAAAGLSRGALLASLFAAREAEVRSILGFAPLTVLAKTKEFQDAPELAARYDLSRYAEPLAAKRIRFYIGNRDERVGTRECFSCIETIVEEAHRQRIRSAPIELIVGPSIGHMGHGTPPETFRHGADWIADDLSHRR